MSTHSRRRSRRWRRQRLMHDLTSRRMCDIIASQCAHLNRCESAHKMLFHSVGCHRQPGSTHTYATSRAGCRGRCRRRRYTTTMCALVTATAFDYGLSIKCVLRAGSYVHWGNASRWLSLSAPCRSGAHAQRYTRRPITFIIRKRLIPPNQCALWLLMLLPLLPPGKHVHIITKNM